MNRKRILAITILIFLSFLVFFILKTLSDAGEFKRLRPHFAGHCKIIDGVLSSEDITVHAPTGLAFISSDDRRPLLQRAKAQQGTIYGYFLSEKNPRLLHLTQSFKKMFHPHGIGLWVSPKQKLSLFVVNHRYEKHFVEIFDYHNKQLVHRASIQGPLMHSPNDVLPVGPRSFYVTNDHGSTSRLGKAAEDYLQLARSNVLYYHQGTFRVVAQGLAYANGINISPDQKTVYVGTSVGGKIYVYRRDPQSGDLALRQAIPLDTGIDNLEVAPNGDLWVAGHPKLLTFVEYTQNPRSKSPSQVLRLSFQKDGSYQISPIYLSHGHPLSGSSVAAPWKSYFLLGSVFDPRFLVCRLSSTPDATQPTTQTTQPTTQPIRP
jgi:arylesterase / paraoxonase